MVRVNRMVLALLTLMLILTGSARAEMLTNPTTSQPEAAAPAPTALPGDAAMPVDSIDFQLHVSMGPAAGPRPNTETATAAAKPNMPLDLALEAAMTAIESCRADGYSVAVAVTDDAGQLLVGMSGDGVAPGRVYIAVRKDLAAVVFKVPTSALRTRIPADPVMRSQIKPNMSVLPGAIPIMIGDRAVGAIGTSGAYGNEEEKCAREGVEKIKARLK